MDSLTLANELRRFFKENRVMIALVTLLTVIAVIGLTFLATRLPNSDSGKDITSNTEIGTPAIFQFYVQTEDGNSFGNSAVVEEFFLQTEIVAEIEKKTGVSIAPLLEEQRLSGFKKTQTDRGILGVMRDGSSHVFTANASLGTEKENLAVMKAYFEYLNSGEIPVLDNKDVYILKEPTNLQFLMNVNEEIEFSEQVNGTVNTKNFILAGVVGLFGGIIAGVVAAFIYQLLRKVITYAFTFSWNEIDIYQRLSRNELHTIQQTVLHPFTETKVILTQHQDALTIAEITSHKRVNLVSETNPLKLGVMNILTVNDLSELDPLLDISECIIFVESGKTEKRWYEKQRMQLKNYNARVKIVQFV